MRRTAVLLLLLSALGCTQDGDRDDTGALDDERRDERALSADLGWVLEQELDLDVGIVGSWERCREFNGDEVEVDVPGGYVYVVEGTIDPGSSGGRLDPDAVQGALSEAGFTMDLGDDLLIYHREGQGGFLRLVPGDEGLGWTSARPEKCHRLPEADWAKWDARIGDEEPVPIASAPPTSSRPEPPATAGAALAAEQRRVLLREAAMDFMELLAAGLDLEILSRGRWLPCADEPDGIEYVIDGTIARYTAEGPARLDEVASYLQMDYAVDRDGLPVRATKNDVTVEIQQGTGGVLGWATQRDPACASLPEDQRLLFEDRPPETLLTIYQVERNGR